MQFQLCHWQWNRSFPTHFSEVKSCAELLKKSESTNLLSQEFRSLNGWGSLKSTYDDFWEEIDPHFPPCCIISRTYMSGINNLPWALTFCGHMCFRLGNSLVLHLAFTVTGIKKKWNSLSLIRWSSQEWPNVTSRLKWQRSRSNNDLDYKVPVRLTHNSKK